MNKFLGFQVRLSPTQGRKFFCSSDYLLLKNLAQDSSSSHLQESLDGSQGIGSDLLRDERFLLDDLPMQGGRETSARRRSPSRPHHSRYYTPIGSGHDQAKIPLLFLILILL